MKRMTLKAFERWLLNGGRDIRIDGAFEIVPCQCGDMNCKGWRLVPACRRPDVVRDDLMAVVRAVVDSQDPLLSKLLQIRRAVDSHKEEITT